MKRPAFQFYPGDWRSNAKLRRCSFAERGIWIEVMCLLHDSDEYGIVRWPLKDIAQAVGCKPSELRSLREKGVLKGCDAGEQVEAYIFTPRHAGRDGEPVTLVATQPGPLWYSSRMVRDEHVRTKRGIGEGMSPIPNRPFGAKAKSPIGDGSSSASSASSSKTAAARAGARDPVDKEGAAAAATELIYPEKLTHAQVESAGEFLNGNPKAQLLLDELTGILATKRVEDPVAMLVKLSEQERAGRFMPSHAHRIQVEREGRQAARELAGAGGNDHQAQRRAH